jgi:uncharacterized repeat protein (TIGR01451 family)
MAQRPVCTGRRCGSTQRSLLALTMTFTLAALAGAGQAEQQAAKEREAASSPVTSLRIEPGTVSRTHRAGVLTGGTPGFIPEVEPNDTSATAQALAATPVRVRATLNRTPFAAGVDVDFYSFTAAAGDVVYAATMTGVSGGSTDTLLDIMDVDGTTVLESDDEDGAASGSASNIAGRVLTAAGTYFVRVRQFGVANLSGTIRPYDLHVRVLSGAPTPEVEPNNNGQTPNPLPANGWVAGVIGVAADNDMFSLTANAGDTIVAILDVDPERDAPEWNARLGIGNFNNFIHLVNGSAVGGTFDDANPSEAFFITVKTAGTYNIYVDEAVSGGAANFTYTLSVSVIPGRTRTCTTYAGTGGPITDLNTTNFSAVVGDSKIIDYLKLNLNITHPATAQADLDVSLIAPDGNEVVLFDDPINGPGTVPAPQINLVLEDEAAIPISLVTGIHAGAHFAPELFSRLEYFKGMQAQGTWTLRVRDDLTANTGTVNSWSLEVCEADPRPACLVPGPNETTVYTNDFEAGDGGFTHSGTQDEWERGLPTSVPITTAHSGTNAWKTDLDATYNNAANFDLLSPNIDLTSVTGRVTLSWWQKFQFESANFDLYWVEVREVGVPANSRRLFAWTGATMTRGVGNPTVTIQQSAGWGKVEADVSDFAGKNVEIRYHVETDGSGQFPGVAVDDVAVTACTIIAGQAVSNVGVTKTDGQSTYFPGEELTYTIVATNAGPTLVNGATITDAFPAELTNVEWTCQASSGSACGSASGSGDISDTVNLLVNGTVTYTATATVSGSATGDITNTVDADLPSGWSDPDTSNNTASDTDVLAAADPMSLAVDAAGNRVFEPGETVVMAPTWQNTGSSAFALSGTLSNHTGPAGGTYGIPDATADYGTIAGGGSGTCTDCYVVTASAPTRPVAHWDSTVLETVNTGATKTWTLHIGDSFDDVPTGSGFYRFIETIFHNSVTAGCAADTYCPADPTSREQMAVFVLVSKEGAGYQPPACGTPMFNDVPASSPFCKFIEELSRRGVVAGCGGGNYCPTTATTREQMAIFVLRTLDPTLDPPACVGGSERFADVPASSPFCRWIEELARRNVVTGCTATDYCPAGNVTREQMSVFLSLTFGLTLYGL